MIEARVLPRRAEHQQVTYTDDVARSELDVVGDDASVRDVHEPLPALRGPEVHEDVVVARPVEGDHSRMNRFRRLVEDHVARRHDDRVRGAVVACVEIKFTARSS